MHDPSVGIIQINVSIFDVTCSYDVRYCICIVIFMLYRVFMYVGLDHSGQLVIATGRVPLMYLNRLWAPDNAYLR